MHLNYDTGPLTYLNYCLIVTGAVLSVFLLFLLLCPPYAFAVRAFVWICTDHWYEVP